MSRSETRFKGFRFRLAPSPEQEARLRQHGGNARFVWNHMLALNMVQYEEDNTFIWAAKMSAKLPGLKKIYPFLAASSAQALQQVCHNLDRALRDACDKTLSKQFPRFKRKGSISDSFSNPQNFRIESGRVKVPKLGWVPWVKHRPLQGRPKSVTVSQDGDHWYASVLCEVLCEVPRPLSDDIIGGDLGLTDFLVTSDGVHHEHPKHLQKLERKLKRAQRSHSRKKKGSSSRRKARKRLARLHRRIRNQRLDFLHKLSHDLIKNHDGVAVENLNVKGMMANHCLAKAIGASGWGEFTRQLEYKAHWYGKHYVEIGRFFPSSKACSGCGCVKDKLGLGERVYRCEHCGLELGRDHNAALNIREEGRALLRARLAA